MAAYTGSRLIARLQSAPLHDDDGDDDDNDDDDGDDDDDNFCRKWENSLKQ